MAPDTAATHAANCPMCGRPLCEDNANCAGPHESEEAWEWRQSPPTTKEIAMETTWRVTEVTEKPGIVLATLQRVEWFKKNPDFDAAMADESEETLPEEFLDALPGEDGADVVELGGAITLDVTEGPDLHPLDNVLLSLRVLTPVEVE